MGSPGDNRKAVADAIQSFLRGEGDGKASVCRARTSAGDRRPSESGLPSRPEPSEDDVERFIAALEEEMD